MCDWKTYSDKIKDLLKSKNLSAAKEELLKGLDKIPNQSNLLLIATDVYRASGDRQKSLEYSELLITHHPDKPAGYIRSAQDLVALQRVEEAQEKIQAGLEKIPNQANLLTIAADLYSEMGKQNKSIEFAKIISEVHVKENKGCPYPIKQLIKNLRNRRGVTENWASFSSTMEEVAAQEDLTIFNLKWLKSICDTYVDHDKGKRGLIAMSISIFLNTLKMGETSRRLHLSEPAKLSTFHTRGELYDGYNFLSLEVEDACLTASWRMTWVLQSDPFMKAIWEEVLSRIHKHSKLLEEFKNLSIYPQRYFPIDPIGIQDNHHLTYEQLYKE